MPITDESIDERTPMVYVLYAQGHVINLGPNGIEFKPHVELHQSHDNMYLVDLHEKTRK